MTSRPLLLLAAAVLLAAAASLVVVVVRSGGSGSALEYPGEPEQLVDVAPTDVVMTADDSEVATVELAITPTGRLLEPPRRPAVRLVRSATGEPLEAAVTWVAGPAAVAGGAPARGQHLLRLDLSSGRCLYRIIQLAGDEIEVELPFEGPYTTSGRVVDEAGAPCVGARIWLAGRRTTTAADGTFSVAELMARSGLPLVIRATGFADHFRVVDVAMGTDPPSYALVAGVAVRVQFAAAVPDDGGGRAYVLPPAGAADTSLRNYPFFLPAIENVGHLASNGACWLSGLPRDRRVRLVVHHPLVPAVAPVAVSLRRDRQLVVVQGDASARISGRIVAGEGVAADGVTIVARAAGRGPAARLPRAPGGWMLPPQAVLWGLASTITAADGSFAVGRSDGERGTLLSVLPERGLGLELLVGRDGDFVAPVVTLPQGVWDSSHGPALQVSAKQATRLVVQRGHGPAVVVALAAGGSHTIQFREPALVDLTITVGENVRHVDALAVAGPIDLPLDIAGGILESRR